MVFMKKIIKNLNNFIKNTISNVQNKTNNNIKIFKNTIFKIQNKTNNNFKIFKNTIFKVKNKKNNNFIISNFNKYLVTFISILFLYLFYLSIPGLYEKSWIQKSVEIKLLDEYKINVSTSSDISYRILPTPHFLIKDSKILINNDNKPKSIAEVKNLKIFLSQGNFFNKENIKFTEIIINKANFSLSGNDLMIIDKSSYNKFSNNKIKIENSKIFVKSGLDDPIAIIKISKAFLFFDDQNQFNLFNLKGESFKIPFSINLKNKIESIKKREIDITAKSLNLNILNEHTKEKDNLIIGNNITSFLNYKIDTNYSVINDTIIFESVNSRIRNHKFNYKGELSVNPFDLDLNIDLGNYRISKILNINSIFSEFIKTGLLFNDNISLSSSIIANSNIKGELFQSAEINLNINNGKINFNKTKFTNNKIGTLRLDNSNLFFNNNNLTLNTNIIIDIQNSNNLFSFLQTNKKLRKNIKIIFINLNYNFLTNEIIFNNIKIDNKEINNQLLTIIDNYDYNKFNNINKSRKFLNELFLVYYDG